MIYNAAHLIATVDNSSSVFATGAIDVMCHVRNSSLQLWLVVCFWIRISGYHHRCAVFARSSIQTIQVSQSLRAKLVTCVT